MDAVPVLPVEASDQGDQIEEPEQSHGLIMVDVKGEVIKPGVYEIDGSARVNDVITLAGGFTDDADVLPVNLAQKVQDEMTIIVPKIGETDGLSDPQNFGSQSNGGGKIRINYASQEELETLPGIGPAKALAIIQYREDQGFFTKVEDLLNISGIGEKTLENFREEIQVP